jgi:succinyl-diaminopimelate desuccinylase
VTSGKDGATAPEPDREPGDDFGDEFDTAAVVALTSALVRLRTVHESESAEVETPAADLLARTMRGFGWDVTVTEVAPGRPTVVAEVHGARQGRTLMFEGHLDVVTEADPDLWSFDPYSGEVINGRLHGRGSADMKSGIAAMVHAARAVQLGGFDGRIILGALADEEGMMLGAKYFAGEVRAGLWGVIDGVIVCEPEGGEVCPVAKGAIRLQVELIGVMAHGAMPQVGRNPVPAAGSLLLGLDQIQQAIRAQTGTHPLLGEFSLTPTVLLAGSHDQINVIPATATLALDIRTVPGVDHRMLIELITRLTDTLAAESGLHARVTAIDDRPPVDTPVDARVVQAMFAGHQAATGRPAVLGGVPGTTDGTILTRDAGLPTVVYGPGGKWIAHQADEYVEVEDIVISTRAYIAAARYFLNGPVG